MATKKTGGVPPIGESFLNTRIDSLAERVATNYRQQADRIREVGEAASVRLDALEAKNADRADAAKLFRVLVAIFAVIALVAHFIYCLCTHHAAVVV